MFSPCLQGVPVNSLPILNWPKVLKMCVKCPRVYGALQAYGHPIYHVFLPHAQLYSNHAPIKAIAKINKYSKLFL